MSLYQCINALEEYILSNNRLIMHNITNNEHDVVNTSCVVNGETISPFKLDRWDFVPSHTNY